ncbi:NlpC/P60 family protein [Parafrankia irregularis]|uniref:NlpC/P60 family protein n=1 Tax=Parafrankia irregularis TaxID=795642 RepID=A0A0S4QVM7_9ACTN|nr:MULTISPECIES: NlpC/P60 family protein [Parafrankia]MBE3202509.1 C40 family peptidase [Parafrankia sp. CH37]CUU59565.1 NlpC/P60 family protein [Parafrankia irregularis]
MARYNAADIYGYARAAGFTPDQAVTMTAIALAESGGDSSAHATRGEDSRGLWQINMDAHRQWADQKAYDPAVNAKLAYEVSRGGRDVSPWTTTHGLDDARYLGYRAQAERAAQLAGEGEAHGNWAGTAGYGHQLTAAGDAGGSHLDETTARFLQAALAQAGDKYVYGAEAHLDDSDPTAFDCSELTQWAAAQAGVEIPDGAAAQYEELRTHGQEISVDDALRTPGALLFRADPNGYISHVAISLGDGRTIEARNSRLGVGVFDNRGDWLNRAAVLPGLSGPVGAGAPPGGYSSSSLALAGGVGTEAAGADSDGDGLTDALESQVGTDSAAVDSDHDNLSDIYELLRVGSDPTSADSDHDGLPDSAELALGSSPTNPDSLGAGHLDGATGPTATLDSDHDGLSDDLERVLGTDPSRMDSDGDGLLDGAEHQLGLDPLAFDHLDPAGTDAASGSGSGSSTSLTHHVDTGTGGLDGHTVL